MVVMQATNCRGFLTCTAAFTPNEKYFHPNSGNGVSVQFVYVLTGKFIVHVPGKPDIIALPGELTDISELAHKEFHCSAGEMGTQYIAINPIPEHKRFTGELVVGSADTQVSGTTKETIIFCLDEDVRVNGIKLVSTQYVNVPYEKTASLSVPAGSVAAIFRAD